MKHYGLIFVLWIAMLMLVPSGRVLAETWTAGGGTNLYWSQGTNWGGTAPANPSANTMVFHDAGATNAAWIPTVVVDQNWTVYGMAFNYWVGNRYFTFDLSGNTLTLNGGDFQTENAWNWDSGAGNIEIFITNGTFKIGATSAANLKVIRTAYVGGAAALTINSAFYGTNINEVQVVPSGAGGGAFYGTLDMRGANIQAFQVNDKVTIGGTGGGGGRGVMYLRGGSVYFDKLYMDALVTTGSLLRIEGTVLTVGNSNSDGFSLTSDKARIIMDFNYPGTRLAVYGDYQSSLPAMNITNYLADGRITYVLPGGVTSNDIKITVSGGYTHIGLVGWVDNDGGASNVTTTTADLNGYLDPTNAPTYVTVFWGTNDTGAAHGGWQYTNYLGLCAPGLLTTNVTVAPVMRYWYRFYATNQWGEIWAPSAAMFETPDMPVINNASGATQVVGSQAKLNGALTNGGQAYVWIYWGTSNGVTNAANWGHTNSLGLLGEWMFSLTVTGLLNGTTYYYRCYASNALGEAWAPATTNFTALDVSGAGRTWDGGGGENYEWTLGANWSGDVIPGRPSTTALTFNDAGSDTQPWTIKSKLDANWTIYGLNFNYWIGNKYFTFDFCGNTLTLNGGDLNTHNAWNWDSAAGNIEIVITNGTLKIGDTSSASLKVVSATYWGIMEMSGNLWERPVTVGNADGRTFTGLHGNGVLTGGGDADVSNWPSPATASGAGCRGGNWYNWTANLCVSDRYDAARTLAVRSYKFGFRCVRVFP